MKLPRYALPVGMALAAAGFTGLILIDKDKASTEELEARRRNVFRAFHRQRVDKVEVRHASGSYVLHKRPQGWFVVAGGTARLADEVEVERLLSELEGAEATRTLGNLDPRMTERFGLDAPRASVVVHEGSQVTARFDLGGAVQDENAVYARVTDDGRTKTVVLPKSFGDVFDRPAVALRDRRVADLDPSRLEAMEITRGDDRMVLTRRGSIWSITEPPLGRAGRGAVEVITSELRSLRAQRVLADGADDATLRRYGLDAPTVRFVMRRGPSEPVTLLFGGACPGEDGEVAATREGSHTVVCFARSFVDALRAPAAGFRDDHVLSARTDEVQEVKVTGAAEGGGDLILRREGSRWTATGVAGGVDAEAVESWLTLLHDISAARRLDGDQRAARGLAPASTVIEVTATGSDTPERVRVGTSDDTGLSVSRDDEPIVLQFAPSAADVLRVDAARFRPRTLVHDVEEDLRALTIDAGPLHEEITRGEGASFSLTRPVRAAADGALVAELARTLASLEAERWVSAIARPEHGLATPTARLVARFEGSGPREPADASVARERSYTITVGAAAPGGGSYASMEGKTGVFVLPRAFVEALTRPHLDRSSVALPREDITRLTITVTGGGARRVALVREGEQWRTETGTPAEASRVEALLEQLSTASGPRVEGYGPARPDEGFGSPTVTVEATYAGDAGAATHRLTIGARFGSGEDVGYYARRDGVDATLSVREALVDALRGFTP
ncbi:MAG: DUF4340 domain-containing protein [Polyangiales bacterium]